MTEIPPGAMRQWEATSVLASVDDLFRRDKLSKDDFPPAMWKFMSYANKVWLLPGSEANADFILFWNKQHFREVGLDPEKGPTTIAELDAMALRLTRENAGQLDRGGDEALGRLRHRQLHPGLALRHGGLRSTTRPKTS